MSRAHLPIWLFLLSLNVNSFPQGQSRSLEVPKLEARDFGNLQSNEAISEDRLSIPELQPSHFVRAYLGDGLLGIRPNPNPLSQSATFAAGFTLTDQSGGFEMSSPAPYPLGTDIRFGTSGILSDPHHLSIQSQMLDMENGELTTHMTYLPEGGPRLDLEITQFLARTVPSIMCQQIRITASQGTSIEIVPQIQHRGVPGTVYVDRPWPRTRISQLLAMSSDRNSKIGIALFIPTSDRLSPQKNGTYLLSLKTGQSDVFTTIAAVVTSSYHPNPDTEATRVARWGGSIGFDELRMQNRKAWKELWKSRVIISGDDEAQRSLDAAFFYLHSSSSSALVTGVAPFGESRWKDYSGHTFWDMDAWIMPATLPAEPDAAKAMIQYRARGLEAAELKAKSFGFQGAMYPWEAGLDGAEVTPAWAETGWAEQHVVPEVAISAWEYYESTGDRVLLKSAVGPITRQVASWILSRGIYTKKGFEIKNVMGHNEGVTGVNNDSMVNLLCKLALRDAIGAAKALGEGVPESWVRAEREILIPIDNAKDIVLPFSQDSPLHLYNRATDKYEAVSLTDHPEAYSLNNLQMLVFHDPPIPYALFKRTWEYEETLRVHQEPESFVPASPRAPGFSTPPVAVCAAMFGDRKKAAELFHLAIERYTLPPFMISKEYQNLRDGNYLMNQASVLMAAMYGFTGLRISEGDWIKYPVSLPEGWTKIEIKQIWIRGVPYHLTAVQGHPAVLTPIGHS